MCVPNFQRGKSAIYFFKILDFSFQYTKCTFMWAECFFCLCVCVWIGPRLVRVELSREAYCSANASAYVRPGASGKSATLNALVRRGRRQGRDSGGIIVVRRCLGHRVSSACRAPRSRGPTAARPPVDVTAARKPIESRRRRCHVFFFFFWQRFMHDDPTI